MTVNIPKDRKSFSGHDARMYLAYNPPNTGRMSQSRGPDNAYFPKGVDNVCVINWSEPSSNPGEGYVASFLIWKDAKGDFQRKELCNSKNDKFVFETIGESIQSDDEFFYFKLYRFGEGSEKFVKVNH